MARLRGILFDLDGVLINSLPSIAACMNHALVSLGRPPLAEALVRPLIGPPIEDSAALLLGSSDPGECAAFIRLYRERYEATCAEETLAMPGLQPVLAALAERWPLALATSKPEVFARKILEALGVSGHFARGGMFGRSLALDNETKAGVVARALLVLGGGEGLVMVGDRKYDVLGAAEHGVPTIGVLHGMGSREELRAAGARWLAPDLFALPGLIDRIDRGEEPDPV